MDAHDHRRGLRRRSVVTGMLAAAATGAVLADSRYPSRPVRVVVPWPPGASVDASARLVTGSMATQLGGSFVVDNKAGASGLLGADLVAKAPADGYTLMLHTSSHPMNSLAFPKLPYDTLTDFASIGRVYTNVLGIVVNAQLPLNNLADFIRYAKTQKEPVNFGSSGLGTPHQMAGEILKMRAGLRMQHIPYKGGGPAAVAVASGQVPMSVCSMVAVLPLLQSKQVRVLAVTQKTRHESWPEIPAVAETFPGFDISGWGAMFAPAGTPIEIITTLHSAMARATQTEAVSKPLITNGLTPAPTSPEELDHIMREEIRRWSDVLKSGVKIT